ncbi:MAG: alpha/beta fold hydrolase, partial [Pseudomonadota bacterium]|nr:alpha/beta fold hydrolase [Pseudomonadota bacterium]
MSARERAAIFAAAPAMAEAERHFLASRDERTVLAYRFPPTGRRENERRALVIHGWRSRSDHMVGVISALRGSGFTVIAIDLPGHGQSTGRRLSMADAAGAVSAAERQFGRFEVIAG